MVVATHHVTTDVIQDAAVFAMVDVALHVGQIVRILAIILVALNVLATVQDSHLLKI